MQDVIFCIINQPIFTFPPGIVLTIFLWNDAVAEPQIPIGSMIGLITHVNSYYAPEKYKNLLIFFVLY